MKSVIIAGLSMAFSLSASAQQKIIIHGKVELLGKSKNILLSGFEPAPIQQDGSFEIKGEIGSPSVALIRTDSSGADGIWLEEGEYTISCKEIKLDKIKRPLFRTSIVKGPADATLYNHFQKNQYSGFDIDSRKGEDPDIANAWRKNRVFKYMDSIITINNNTPVLANMVRSVQFHIGDDSTKALIQKLSPELRKSSEIAMLENDFKRKDKIASEKKFEAFTINDIDGKPFSLVSLRGKKAILLDFWASDCGPCRATHPKLISWYEKYKDQGLQIVSISIDTEESKWIDAMKKDGIENWINVSELKGWKTSLMENYFIPFIPFKFLLDEDLNIIEVENMATSWIEEKDIIELLNK